MDRRCIVLLHRHRERDAHHFCRRCGRMFGDKSYPPPVLYAIGGALAARPCLRKPINPIERISERLFFSPSPPPFLLTHGRRMEGRDTHVGREKPLLAREGPLGAIILPVGRRGENSDGEKTEPSSAKRRERVGISEQRRKGERVRGGGSTRTARGRGAGGERGEGDATRLINRHADNHSGFMVTTDYQVVQGGIFHIRDVTLFQWGNTCSARYKLHERAYTGRHVCCLRILRSPSLHPPPPPPPFPPSQVCTYRGIYGRDLWRTHRLGTRDATELARRGVHTLSLSLSSFLFHRLPLSPRSSPLRLELRSSRSSTPRLCPSLKIIPTFARVRLQKWPATFPRDRSPDRSPTTTPYTGSISGSRD